MEKTVNVILIILGCVICFFIVVFVMFKCCVCIVNEKQYRSGRNTGRNNMYSAGNINDVKRIRTKIGKSLLKDIRYVDDIDSISNIDVYDSQLKRYKDAVTEHAKDELGLSPNAVEEFDEDITPYLTPQVDDQ